MKYVPRLSKIDTETNNVDLSYLLFSGEAAQTEAIVTKHIQFFTFDRSWYDVGHYCFKKDENKNKIFRPENNISEFLE